MTDAKEKDEKPKEPEYPRWVYPPDGGPGKIVQTPEETPSGWLLQPKEGGEASGEKVIGSHTFTGQYTDHTKSTVEDDDDKQKSKKK